jgi:hypothetical protein
MRTSAFARYRPIGPLRDLAVLLDSGFEVSLDRLRFDGSAQRHLRLDLRAEYRRRQEQGYG